MHDLKNYNITYSLGLGLLFCYTHCIISHTDEKANYICLVKYL